MPFPQTVDTYYRRCSSSTYVGNVAVPLLCISALDDPVCTREAIPWDECRSSFYCMPLYHFLRHFECFYRYFIFNRANKNVVLATTRHGGHLAFFEGMTAASVWYFMLPYYSGTYHFNVPMLIYWVKCLK